MKSTKIILLLFLAIGLSLSACKKKDDETDPGDNSTTGGSMTAKVNGNNWEATLAVVGIYENELLSITGNDSDSKQLQINIMNVTGTGEYELGGDPTNPNTGRWTEGIGQDDTYMTQLGLGSGTVNITEWSDSQVKGTFSFTAKNGSGVEVSVTDGNFTADL